MSEFTWNKLDDKWTKLVDDHWSYVKGVIERSPGYCESHKWIVDMIGWNYKGAFLHGIKHCKEEPPTVLDYLIVSGMMAFLFFIGLFVGLGH